MPSSAMTIVLATVTAQPATPGGNEAVACVAHALNKVIAIYPITNNIRRISQ